VLLESAVESAFRAPWLVAIAMIVMSGALAWAEAAGPKRVALLHISFFEALLMGLGQALAIVPGVSRSGGSITAGMLAGMTREGAARFSFIMAAPIMAGAGAKRLKDVAASGVPADDQQLMLAGFAVSAVVGLLAIHLLLRYLQSNTLYVFVAYRVLLGVAVIGVFLVRGG
jgi:undecaprenyl-diphosphatase